MEDPLSLDESELLESLDESELLESLDEPELLESLDEPVSVVAVLVALGG